MTEEIKIENAEVLFKIAEDESASLKIRKNGLEGVLLLQDIPYQCQEDLKMISNGVEDD